MRDDTRFGSTQGRCLEGRRMAEWINLAPPAPKREVDKSGAAGAEAAEAVALPGSPQLIDADAWVSQMQKEVSQITIYINGR